ncbi:LysR substrate-binding domain-containing protein [Flavobacterium sp. SM2513]|uniref:LysR substrate-binding domain-containing protein n=1 Tax=Flavobacterium sp. SM2513 TaxID=3424766 RepID=UPI003D7FFB3A
MNLHLVQQVKKTSETATLKLVNDWAFEQTTNEAVKQVVIAEMGSSILPTTLLKHELTDDDLKIIPIKNLPIKTMWSLICLKNKKHSPVTKSYLDYLQENKERIISEKTA